VGTSYKAALFVLLGGVAIALLGCNNGTHVVAPIGGTPMATPSAAASPSPGTSATPSPTRTATPNASPTAMPTASPTAMPTATRTASPSPTPTGTVATAGWPLFGHDSAHSGVSSEMTVGSLPFTMTKLWQVSLGGVADAAPVVWNNMLYITRNDGTTLGISTSNGATVWTFTTSGPNIQTGGPAYDVSANMLYAPGVDGKVHRLHPTTGVEDTTGGFPVTVLLATQTEKIGSPLNLAGGFVYAQTSAHFGDASPSVGHVVAINTATGQRHVFNTLCASQTTVIQPSTCSQQLSGMWSRAGVVVDPDASMNGQLYVTTGNGDYNPSAGDYGDSILALPKDASSLVSHYTPPNFAALANGDIDLGSTSPALIPRLTGTTTPLLAVQGGKDAILRLLDRTNLGAAPLQSVSLPEQAEMVSAPAVYRTSSGQTFVYVGMPNNVFAYQVTVSNGTPQLSLAWTAGIAQGNGTSPIVRAGVVYVAATNQLVALDATTGATVGSSNALGSVHWQSPIVAQGVVYCSDTSGKLTAFSVSP